MKLLPFLSMVYYIQARVIDIDCEGILVRNVVHEKEVLVYVDNSPYHFSIDYSTKTLFFTYATIICGCETFVSAYLNLETIEFHTIDDIVGGFANAVDTKTHTIYIGARADIYKFNFETNKTERLNITDHSIWQLFYRNNLYYISFPDQMAYIYKDGKVEKVPELSDTRAMFFNIDNNNNLFFSNASGLYIYDNVKNIISSIGKYKIECLTTDINGKLHFCTDEGIYCFEDGKVEKLVSLKHIYSMAVEKDGSLIVGLYNKIIRIKPTNKQCPVGKY